MYCLFLIIKSEELFWDLDAVRFREAAALNVRGRIWGCYPSSRVHTFTWGPAVYCGPAQADPVGGNSGRASSGQDRLPMVWTGLKNGRNVSASKQEPESFQYQGKQEGGIWKLSDKPVERLERPHQRITVTLRLTFFFFLEEGWDLGRQVEDS